MLRGVFQRESKSYFEKTAGQLREVVTRELVEEEGFTRDVIETELYLNMRFEGTDAPMMIKEPSKIQPFVRSWMNFETAKGVRIRDGKSRSNRR